MRSSELSCPFCETKLPGTCVLSHAAPVGRVASRAVLSFFAATTALTACGKSQQKAIEEQPTVTVYGPPPMAIDATPPLPMISDAGKDGDQ